MSAEWKVVPVEPSWEMRQAAFEAGGRPSDWALFDKMWVAALATVPTMVSPKSDAAATQDVEKLRCEKASLLLALQQIDTLASEIITRPPSKYRELDYFATLRWIHERILELGRTATVWNEGLSEDQAWSLYGEAIKQMGENTDPIGGKDFAINFTRAMSQVMRQPSLPSANQNPFVGGSSFMVGMDSLLRQAEAFDDGKIDTKTVRDYILGFQPNPIPDGVRNTEAVASQAEPPAT